MTDHHTRLRRVRVVVRFTLTLGVATSVVANVLHADPNPISQAIAAWAPLALLLSVELISRVPVHRPVYAWTRMLATAVIAGIAAWVSYWHMVGVATRYGETGPTPYLLPISVDGLIIVASISLIELGGRIRDLETTTSPAAPPPGSQPAADTRPFTSAPTRAVAIPPDTANHLAATFTRPTPATPAATSRTNGATKPTSATTPALVQEPLL